jgi:hypothetical protein
LNHLDRISKNIKISNLIKIRRMGDELFHADWQRDRHDETNSRCGNVTNSPKNELQWFTPLKEGFLGAFAKLRKATITFTKSVRLSIYLSVSMEQLGSHWNDFRKIWYLNVFRKSVEKIQLSLTPDKNNWYFTWRPIFIFYYMSFISS